MFVIISCRFIFDLRELPFLRFGSYFLQEKGLNGTNRYQTSQDKDKLKLWRYQTEGLMFISNHGRLATVDQSFMVWRPYFLFPLFPYFLVVLF